VLFQPLAISDDRWDEWATRRSGLLRDNVGGGQDNFLEQIAPSRASDASFRDWYLRAGRAGASPTTAGRIWESVLSSRPGDQPLGQIVTPTLVLHRKGDAYVPPEAVDLAASQINGATVVELDGADHFPFLGDVDAVVAEIASFVVGERRLPPPQRLLAALLFTDLVASTERATSLGDTGWKSVLDRHDKTVREAVGRCGGTVVKTTGDGVLALLPSATAAVRASRRIRDDLAVQGLAVRIGIHVGDIDRRGDDVSGIAVHIGARVLGLASPGEVLVSRTVTDLVAGSGIEFADRGEYQLKGVAGSWQLFAVAG